MRLHPARRALVAASLALAVPAASGAAEAGPGIFPFQVHEKSLANGFRMLVVPTDHPGVLSYYTVVRAGSRNEVEPGKTGFAHFFEHMMFRGTEKYSGDQYNDMLKKMGADNNAWTSDDETVYHTTASASELEKIMDMEADRFQNLEYGEAAFQKESRAVLGEYNKSASSPFLLMDEKLMDTAFTTHTYKHTTIGFLKDIEDMPNQFEYSKVFFDRWYRPEHCILLVVGDVKPETVFALGEKYYGGWKRGSSTIPEVPAEPVQTAPRQVELTWPNPTLPYLILAWKAPAFSATDKHTPSLDLLSQVYFGPTSPLYRKLVIDEQLVEWMQAGVSDHRDPHLFSIWVRLKSKDKAAADKVRAAIEAALAEAKGGEADAKRLRDVKSALKYGVGMRLDTTDGIAGTLSHFLVLTGDWASMNRLYATYDSLTAADLREAARRTFLDTTLTTLKLTEEVKK